MSSTFLLLRPDKAGDALKSLPALRALRKHGPAGNYYLLASPHNASLLQLEPGYTVVSQETIPDLQWDKIVSLPCDIFDENDRLLRSIPGPKYSTGFRGETPPEDWTALTLPGNAPAHSNESLNIARLLSQAFDCDLVSPLQDFPKAPAFDESDHAEASQRMGEKKGNWLGFCPFAGTSHRTHPLSNWAKFISKASSSERFDRFFIFGTLSDLPEMDALKERCDDPEKVSLVFPSSFRTLGAYLLRLNGLVAVDSGPLHLAHTLDIPTLGVLSGGDVGRWFPSPGPHSRLLPRGLFSRYPSVIEMNFAFRRWLIQSPAVFSKSS